MPHPTPCRGRLIHIIEHPRESADGTGPQPQGVLSHQHPPAWHVRAGMRPRGGVGGGERQAQPQARAVRLGPPYGHAQRKRRAHQRHVLGRRRGDGVRAGEACRGGSGGPRGTLTGACPVRQQVGGSSPASCTYRPADRGEGAGEGGSAHVTGSPPLAAPPSRAPLYNSTTTRKNIIRPRPPSRRPPPSVSARQPLRSSHRLQTADPGGSRPRPTLPARPNRQGSYSSSARRAVGTPPRQHPAPRGWDPSGALPRQAQRRHRPRPPTRRGGRPPRCADRCGEGSVLRPTRICTTVSHDDAPPPLPLPPPEARLSFPTAPPPPSFHTIPTGGACTDCQTPLGSAGCPSLDTSSR